MREIVIPDAGTRASVRAFCDSLDPEINAALRSTRAPEIIPKYCDNCGKLTPHYQGNCRRCGK